MPGGVQLAAEHRGPAHRRAVSDLSRRLLLRVQRAVAGRPYLPRAPAHDVTLTLSWKQVSQAPADCSHTVEGVRQDKTCYCCKQTANLIMIELIVFFFTAHCLNCKSADTFPIFKSTALPLHIKKKRPDSYWVDCTSDVSFLPSQQRPWVECKHYFRINSSVFLGSALCVVPVVQLHYCAAPKLWLCQTDWCHWGVTDLYWNSIVSVPKGGGGRAPSQLVHCTEGARALQWSGGLCSVLSRMEQARGTVTFQAELENMI